jgi:hypothetical protein
MYITIKRFKRNGIGGYFNIPYGTELENRDGVLWHGDKPVCKTRSAAAHEYFARNDDGCGLERGTLTHEIIKALGGFTIEPDDRWEKVFENELAQQYRRPEHQNYWLWSDAFFNAAPIEDLKQIAVLVGVKGV